MKRIIAFLLCVLIAAALFGCTAESKKKNKDTTAADAAVDINAKDDSEDTEETTGEEDGSTESTDEPETEAESESDSADTTAPETPATTACGHNSTHLINQKTATCAAQGYTGDAQCDDCGAVVSRGTATSVTAVHNNTEVRNRREATTASEGYTGDTHCKDCGAKLSSGTVIAKLKLIHTFGDGSVLEYEESQKSELFINTIKKAGKSAAHSDEATEKAIFNAVNAERQKAGVAPLQWCEEAYYFANVRSKEIVSKFSHTRADGRSWSTVYDDAHVAWNITGENVAAFPAGGNLADKLMKAWMESTGHRDNILRPDYKYFVVSVYTSGSNAYAVQNFFG